MSIELRILLIVVSVVALLYTVRKIRHSKMNISDSIFWIVFAVVLIIISVIPQIIVSLAALLGILSPQNLIFLLMIGILVLKLFLLSLKMSQLQDKLTLLTQKVAIEEYLKHKKD